MRLKYALGVVLAFLGVGGLLRATEVANASSAADATATVLNFVLPTALLALGGLLLVLADRERSKGPKPHPVTGELPEGWYPDPTGRFERRRWDGTSWTDQVISGRQPGSDPLPATNA